MTNIKNAKTLPRVEIKEAVRKSLKKRYVIETIFKSCGLSAIILALVILIFLLYSLISQGLGAFKQTHIALDIHYPQIVTVKPSVQRDSQTNKIAKDAEGNYLFDFSRSKIGHIPYTREGRNKITFDLSQLSERDFKHVVMAAEASNFTQPLREAIREAGGDKEASKLINIGAEAKVRNYLKNNPKAAGQNVSLWVPVQADFDYWWRYRGRHLNQDKLAQLDAEIKLVQEALASSSVSDENSPKPIEPSLQKLRSERIKQVGRFENFFPIIFKLKKENLLNIQISWRIFTNLDASEADYAGLRSAIVGTAYTMFVTFLISFFLGVGAAIWLEEFAPKGKFSDFIEVNINNLAAVPSIVKGILGLLVFQMPIILPEFMPLFGGSTVSSGLPRGTPLLGGIVLSLIAMPTIIVASRASLKSVPPNLKQGALGLGASHKQAVFQHVAPAALPGMLTGTIIGLAQALGETAPLLMIGMKSFSPTPPSGIEGFTESATTIAATIYNWFSLGKDSFNELASAAILVLLFFLLCMNALAVYLRKKFELDW